MGQKKVSFIERCPYFRGCKSGSWGGILERCPQFKGVLIEGFHCKLHDENAVFIFRNGVSGYPSHTPIQQLCRNVRTVYERGKHQFVFIFITHDNNSQIRSTYSLGCTRLTMHPSGSATTMVCTTTVWWIHMQPLSGWAWDWPDINQG